MAGQAAFDSIFGKAVTSYVADKEKVDSDETKNDEKMKVKLCNLNGLDVTEEEESAAELKPEPESLWNILQESTKAATVFEAPGSSQSVPGPLALIDAVQVAAIKDRETFKALEDVAHKDLANKRQADGPADEALAEDQPNSEQLQAVAAWHGADHQVDQPQQQQGDHGADRQDDPPKDQPNQEQADHVPGADRQDVQPKDQPIQEQADQPQQQQAEHQQAEPVPDQEEDPRAGMPPVHLTTSTFARRKRPKTAEVAQLRWDVLRAAFVHEIKPLLTAPSAHEDC